MSTTPAKPFVGPPHEDRRGYYRLRYSAVLSTGRVLADWSVQRGPRPSARQSRRRCGRRGEPSPGADVAGVSPSPGADVAQVWQEG